MTPYFVIPSQTLEYADYLWRMLEGTGIKPLPLEECRRVTVTVEQATQLIRETPSAPIPNSVDALTKPFIVIEFERGAQDAVMKMLSKLGTNQLMLVKGIDYWLGGTNFTRELEGRLQLKDVAFWTDRPTPAFSETFGIKNETKKAA